MYPRRFHNLPTWIPSRAGYSVVLLAWLLPRDMRDPLPSRRQLFGVVSRHRDRCLAPPSCRNMYCGGADFTQSLLIPCTTTARHRARASRPRFCAGYCPYQPLRPRLPSLISRVCSAEAWSWTRKRPSTRRGDACAPDSTSFVFIFVLSDLCCPQTLLPALRTFFVSRLWIWTFPRR
jgi:hypothetical protein